MTTHSNDIDTAQLPATIRAFLAAHAAREVDAAMRAFAADPLVVDQDETFEGTEQVRHFLTDAGAEFAYTAHSSVPVVRTTRAGGAVIHLSDFPGGVADLEYAFVLDGDLVSQLRIR